MNNQEFAKDNASSELVSRSAEFYSRGGLLTEEDIEKSLLEYEENTEEVSLEFKRRTGLQDADTAFLFFATALQVARINIVGYLMQEEPAGKDNRLEKASHKVQDKLLEPFKRDGKAGLIIESRTYPSAQELIQTRGVPYDATRFASEKFKFFKGANHRFATLGHDSLLGFLFGTADIITDSITTVSRSGLPGIGIHVPMSYQVLYDINRSHPAIGAPVPTPLVLQGAAKSIVNDPAVLAIATIKQIMHIVSDLRTPCGIQLPAANLLLGNEAAEKLTAYISAGDVAVIGAQVSLATFINKIIEAIHGSTLLFQDDGSDYSVELYHARTKKIISMSNAIASGSDVIMTAMSGGARKLDIGGLAVTLSRLFNDSLFISKLKYEYLNTEVSKIYEKRAVGLLDAKTIERLSADYAFGE